MLVFVCFLGGGRRRFTDGEPFWKFLLERVSFCWMYGFFSGVPFWGFCLVLILTQSGQMVVRG